MTPQTEYDPHAPWRPEGMRGFVVGDRVRVRLSGECVCFQHEQNGLLRRNLDLLTGTVYQPGPLERTKFLDHNIYIHFDDPVEVGWWAVCTGGAFLPNELELLEAAR